jgi:hypothetical protein
MTLVLLTPKQKMLLKYQRKNVIDEVTSSSAESVEEGFDPMKLLNHKNKRLSLLYSDRLKKTIQSYEGKDLTAIDRKLIQGLHEKKIPDTEEQKDRIMNVIRKYLLKKLLEERQRRRLEPP